MNAVSLASYDGAVGQRLTVELIPDRELGGYAARVPDIPAYGEGGTQEGAIADLEQALRAYVETLGVQDAVSRIDLRRSRGPAGGSTSIER